MSDLIDTTEMYLRTIFELEEQGIVPLRARIAERLGHSGPTVSQTISRMERDGLVRVSGDRHLEMTSEGRARAVRVMRKHRLAERLLTDIIRLDWAYAHDEACRWEHVMSDMVENQLMGILTDPRYSPYGNPIPGLGELGVVVRPEPFLQGVIALDEALSGGVDRRMAVVARLGEPLQTDVELLTRFAEAGVLPGASVQATRSAGLVSVGAPGAQTVLDLPDELAQHVFVAAA